jgi:hypothetical protein
MKATSGKRLAWGAAALLCAATLAPAAQAEDFISALFGAFRPHAPQIRLPFASEGDPVVPQGEARPRYAGGGQAYCVRTCDGRYFPISASNNRSRAAACDSFCPASDTRVVYGSNIDNAATENGKSYSELPNAFRYRGTGRRMHLQRQVKLGLAPVGSRTIRRCRATSSPKGRLRWLAQRRQARRR